MPPKGVQLFPLASAASRLDQSVGVRGVIVAPLLSEGVCELTHARFPFSLPLRLIHDGHEDLAGNPRGDSPQSSEGAAESSEAGQRHQILR